MPLLSMAVLILGADDPTDRRLADQTALKPLGGLVGTWRGVGMIQRNQSKGAWRVSADWSWKLSEDSAALRMSLSDGKYLKAVEIRPGKGKQAGEFLCDAVMPDDSRRTFAGRFNDREQLILVASDKPRDGPARLTITPLHDTRFLFLLESVEGVNRYRRLGEVGYTREGVAFAAGDSGPVCIVTGGRGTIALKYKGQTYHVCCSGCKQLFDENPEKVIAQARDRKP